MKIGHKFYLMTTILIAVFMVNAAASVIMTGKVKEAGKNISENYLPMQQVSASNVKSMERSQKYINIMVMTDNLHMQNGMLEGYEKEKEEAATSLKTLDDFVEQTGNKNLNLRYKEYKNYIEQQFDGMEQIKDMVQKGESEKAVTYLGTDFVTIVTEGEQYQLNFVKEIQNGAEDASAEYQKAIEMSHMVTVYMSIAFCAAAGIVVLMIQWGL